MKFLVGLLAGMLLAGPTVEHHYHITETNRLRLDREVTVNPPTVYEVTTATNWEDGWESCVIELLDDGTPSWGADEVIGVLDDADEAGVSPCELPR